MKSDFQKHIIALNSQNTDSHLFCLTLQWEGIWMSFFDTEEAHAVRLAYAAYGGGRAALKVTPMSLNL
jgi:hypothetical protein